MVGECRDSFSLCGWVEGFGLRLGGWRGWGGGGCEIRGQRILCLLHLRCLGQLRGSRGILFSETVFFLWRRMAKGAKGIAFVRLYLRKSAQ